MNKKSCPSSCLLLLPLFLFILLMLPQAASATGWYVRGALGYETSLTANFSDKNSTSIHPPALFGLANGSDGQPIGATGDFGRFPLAEGAFGRQILPWLRSEVALSYRMNMGYEGNANFLSVGTVQPVSAKADSLCGMANVFIDINGFWTRKLFRRFQPYVGAGIGIAHNRIERMTFLFPQNPRSHKISITPSGEKTNFAYMLAVGTAVLLTDRLKLDIAYRYFDLGKVETSQGIMYMNTLPAGIAIDSIEAPLRTHGLTVGLRYHF